MIGGDRNADVETDAVPEAAQRQSNAAAAAASNSDEQAEPGTSSSSKKSTGRTLVHKRTWLKI